MGILFDDVVSGVGTAHLGDPATVNYVLYGLVANDQDYARPAAPWDATRLLRVGYFAFSYYGFDFGDPIDFWDEPKWMDFTSGRWLPGPLIPPSTTFRWYATNMRWGLSPGVQVRIQVND
jgi:hypothetical protein